MEYFNINPDLKRFPPEEVRITSLRVIPESDNLRIRVFLELTPFEEKPVIEMVLSDEQGREITSTSIIEPISWKQELVMHLKKPVGGMTGLHLTASLVYPEKSISMPLQATLSIPVHLINYENE